MAISQTCTFYGQIIPFLPCQNVVKSAPLCLVSFHHAGARKAPWKNSEGSLQGLELQFKSRCRYDILWVGKRCRFDNFSATKKVQIWQKRFTMSQDLTIGMLFTPINGILKLSRNVPSNSVSHLVWRCLHGLHYGRALPLVGNHKSHRLWHYSSALCIQKYFIWISYNGAIFHQDAQ